MFKKDPVLLVEGLQLLIENDPYAIVSTSSSLFDCIDVVVYKGNVDEAFESQMANLKWEHNLRESEYKNLFVFMFNLWDEEV